MVLILASSVALADEAGYAETKRSVETMRADLAARYAERGVAVLDTVRVEFINNLTADHRFLVSWLTGRRFEVPQHGD